MKQTLPEPRMPRSLKPLLLMQNHQPQLRMRRPMLRYPVTVTLQIVTQRSNTLLEQLPQPVEESTDSLTEYRQVMRLMILGTMTLTLMSTHTHTQHSSTDFNTGRERLIRSHLSARFCFELSGNSN